ncbi:MAG: AzlC family ABC transporter permease [Candidatus Puniceispirillaceae bacterium]
MKSSLSQGIWDAAKLPGLALSSTMLGFASMAREAGFSFAMVMASTGGVWGLPGQVAMVGLWAGGSGLFLIFCAVAMANMRMLLMVISASDIMNVKQLKIPLWKHILTFHLMAITSWVQIGYVAPHYRAEELQRYYYGFASTLFTMSLTGTAIGYYIADIMPAPYLRVLIYITPLYLILLGLSARQFGNRLAVALGGLFALALFPFIQEMALFIAGIAGGLAAFMVTLREDKRKAQDG